MLWYATVVLSACIFIDYSTEWKGGQEYGVSAGASRLATSESSKERDSNRFTTALYSNHGFWVVLITCRLLMIGPFQICSLFFKVFDVNKKGKEKEKDVLLFVYRVTPPVADE